MSVSWMSILSHENHIHTKNQTMKSHGCWCYHMKIMCIQRIKLWKVIDVYVIAWESYTKNQSIICQYHGYRYYHMRNTYEESNYNTSLPCSYYCMCNMADVKFILRNQMDDKCLWFQYRIWIQDSKGYSGVLVHHFQTIHVVNKLSVRYNTSYLKLGQSRLSTLTDA